MILNSDMKILVTGADGFIGKNLVFRLYELDISVVTFTRKNSIQDLPDILETVDFIVHLAGENRPLDDKDLDFINVGMTMSISEAVRHIDRKIPIIFTSSVQAKLANTYGQSKLKAEVILKSLHSDMGNPVYIFRLPGVFGKWCKPNYNSVVATFCHNISHSLPIQVNDSSSELKLVYIDDVVEKFVSIIHGKEDNNKVLTIQPEYTITVGELEKQIKLFHNSRKTLISERVGRGLIRKLYSTYVSSFSPLHFSYPLKSYDDERGTFAEVLKTKDSGQFSFFTAEPGETRGGHYHNSKTEKFLVVSGKARFRFRNIITNEVHEVFTSEKKLEIVETVPGWSHNLKNIGEQKMAVMLWANEIFDQYNSDTISFKV